MKILNLYRPKEKDMTSPLSQAQLSIFLASQGLDRFSGNYQQALLFKLPGHIELEKLKGALESLVSTHPYILSRISTESGAPVMVESGEQWTAEIKEVGSIEEARRFFGRDKMEQIVKSVNRKEEGGDGLADEFVLKYAKEVA